MKPTKTKLRKKLDKLWSDRVKERAGYRCERCPKTDYLNSHHIIGRINLSLRWNLENGVCLCVGCHKFNQNSAHNNPIDFLKWVSTIRDLDYLQTKSLELTHYKLHNYQEMIDTFPTV